jgi:hypothetical protein
VIGHHLGTALAAAMAATLAGGAAGLTSASAGAADECPLDAFCDSFEDAAPGGPPGGDWTAERRGEPLIQVDRGEAYRGRQSVRITAAGRETAFISLEGSPLFPLAGNVMYGRVMMKLSSTPEKRVHWTIIEGKGASADGGHAVEYRYGGARPIERDGVYQGSRLMANYETPGGPRTDCWHAAANSTVMPTGRWVCLAWMFDGPNSGMKLWLDGRLQDDLTVAGSGQGCMGAPAGHAWQAPIFDRINLGWETYKEDEPRTLWIDDVAIGRRPLACPVQ